MLYYRIAFRKNAPLQNGSILYHNYMPVGAVAELPIQDAASP